MSRCRWLRLALPGAVVLAAAASLPRDAHATVIFASSSSDPASQWANVSVGDNDRTATNTQGSPQLGHNGTTGAGIGTDVFYQMFVPSAPADLTGFAVDLAEAQDGSAAKLEWYLMDIGVGTGTQPLDWSVGSPQVLDKGTISEQAVPTGAFASYAVTFSNTISVGPGKYALLLVDPYHGEAGAGVWRWQWDKDTLADPVGNGGAYISGKVTSLTTAQDFKPYNGGDFALVVYALPDTAGLSVPEPATLAAALLSILGLAAARLRRS